jgi:hypothetical protein
MTTLSGGIFNFTDGTYTPVSWSGSVFNFTHGLATDFTLNQIWTDDNYVYMAINLGCYFVDVDTETTVAFINHDGGFNSVWAGDEGVFFASNEGIKYITTANVSGDETIPVNLTGYVQEYERDDLTDERVRYIHSNGDRMIACTASGVDIIRHDPRYIFKTYTSSARKCFAATNSKYYYTTSGTGWAVNRVDNGASDWTSPDASYTTSGIFSSASRLNDIFVTAGTSTAGPEYNTLFVATDIGAYVYDEGENRYLIFTTVS